MTTRPRYDLLDGLRGVAALMVLVYHVFECFTATPVPHGYLAVDFFFVLSGFVIGYAYDDRWACGLTLAAFARRRLVRLHPMVLVGAVGGAAAFCLQGSCRWDGTPVAAGWVVVAMLAAMFMVPAVPGSPADVRGNNEMFPLNGPAWSLFFEYIGNVLYALLLRRLPTRVLAAVAAGCGAVLLAASVHAGSLGVGWTMAEGGFWLGMVRMLFPYTAGMLLARCFRPLPVRHAFGLGGAVLVGVGSVPLLGGDGAPWANGLFDALCVLLLFPALVWCGASQTRLRPATARIARLPAGRTELSALRHPLPPHVPLLRPHRVPGRPRSHRRAAPHLARSRGARRARPAPGLAVPTPLRPPRAGMALPAVPIGPPSLPPWGHDAVPMEPRNCIHGDVLRLPRRRRTHSITHKKKT